MIRRWRIRGVTGEIPTGVRVLLVGIGRDDVDEGAVSIWTEGGDPSGEELRRKVHVVGTGWEPPKGAEHLGSVIVGDFVWHLYSEEVAS